MKIEDTSQSFSIKDGVIDGKLTLWQACFELFDDLTQEDIDFLVKEHPDYAAKILPVHKLFSDFHAKYLLYTSPLAIRTMAMNHYLSKRGWSAKYNNGDN